MSRRVPFLLACAAMSACADDGPTDPLAGVVPIPAGLTASALISPAGGDLVLSAPNGATFTLALPAGAVDVATNVTVTTVEASRQQRFHLRFAPAGLEFGVPASVTVVLPQASRLSDDGVVAYNGVPLRVERLAGGALRVQLRSFSSAAPLAAIRDGDVLANAETTIPPCGGIPTVGSFESGGLTASDRVAINVFGECMLAAVTALIASGDYGDAARTADAVGAYLERAGEGDPAAFKAQAITATCGGLSVAIAAVGTANIDGYGEFDLLLGRLLFIASTLDLLGGSCPGVTTAQITEAAEEARELASQFYAEQEDDITVVTSPAYASARTEARANQRLIARVSALAPSATVQGIAESAVEAGQGALLQAMLDAPYTQCVEAGDRGPLVELYEIVGNASALRSAVEFCGTALTMESRTSSDSTLETLPSTLGAGSGFAAPRLSAAMRAATNGTLRITGTMLALPCAPGVLSDEALAITLDGVTVATLNAAPYFANAYVLDLAQARAAAGIAADDRSVRLLTLRRTGSGCGRWGAWSGPYVTVSLDFSDGPVLFRGAQAVWMNGLPGNSCGPGSANIDTYELRIAYPSGARDPSVELWYIGAPGDDFAFLLTLDSARWVNPRITTPAPVNTFIPVAAGSRDGTFVTELHLVSENGTLYRRRLDVVVAGDTATWTYQYRVTLDPSGWDDWSCETGYIPLFATGEMARYRGPPAP